MIQTIGDLYLEAAADFRNIYPDYLGNLPMAEKVLTEELETNLDFRLFVEVSQKVSGKIIDYGKGSSKTDGPAARHQTPDC